MHKPLPPAFDLSHSALERLFAAYHIPLRDEGLVLFGLRGCLPVGAASGWRASAKARAVPVDYAHMRCTLGIWDRKGKRVFLAPGSTVPHKDNVEKAAAKRGRAKGRGTNQLEPGFYTDLAKGEHLQGKRNGHQALRQTGYRFYRRSRTGVPYTASAPLFYGNPYDNLHCGWNLDGKAAGFSSAGCMVVAGMPHCPRRDDQPENLGPWRIFHDLLYEGDQETFPLLLVPGTEAAEALSSGTAAGKGPGKRAGRLIYGSEGDAVAALQNRLAARGTYRGAITGRLDARTYRAWKRPSP
ncbi:MAG: Peptidoglycan-binding domain 1 protein [Fibrobacteres bacterium]|nr:Peptidoglycan-binding domain 1 protein [Fibrobacterota bacterium]